MNCGNSKARLGRRSRFQYRRCCGSSQSDRGQARSWRRFDFGPETTSHIERVFLTVGQELKRFQRKGLGYSKDLATHKVAVALNRGVYNLVRKHTTLRTTPAVAAGVEIEPWGLEKVVEMTAAYLRRKEDAEFEKAFAEAGCEKP